MAKQKDGEKKERLEMLRQEFKSIQVEIEVFKDKRAAAEREVRRLQKMLQMNIEEQAKLA